MITTEEWRIDSELYGMFRPAVHWRELCRCVSATTGIAYSPDDLAIAQQSDIMLIAQRLAMLWIRG